MDITRVIIGYTVSSLGGALLLWIVIEKIAWGYTDKKLKERGGNPLLNCAGPVAESKKPSSLTVPLGIVERVLYTTSFIIGAEGWVAVWLGMKVAVSWNRWQGDERITYNVFLIGNALSILIALIGAWIALGQLPVFK